MRRTTLGPSIFSCVFALACATPVVKPVDVQPVTPGRGESITTDQSITLVDSSGSISRTKEYPSEKALVQSLVSSMPAGNYEAGAIEFGGTKRNVHPLGAMDRSALNSYAGDMKYLSEGTPLDQALKEAGTALAGKSDRAAVTVISDGRPTDVVGRELPEGGSEQRALEAAQGIQKGYKGTVCIHSVQIGNDPAGTEFLQKLSKTTGCGSYRNASSLNSASALQSFQREVYMGAAPVVAAVDGDDDGDGVPNSKDQCPRTPRGVRVDARGCWVAVDLHFAHDSAQVELDSEQWLVREAVPIMKNNPNLRIRIDGHTDSSGPDAYNQKLSERRAAAVRKVFVDHGVDPSRLETRGFGESQPAVANDSPENMRLNRRVEFTPISNE